MIMRFVALLIVVFAASASAASTPTGKTFTLWMGNPLGFWGGEYNQTKVDAAMVSLDHIKDLVDVVSMPTFFFADPANGTLVNATGGLVPGESAAEVTALVQQAGFLVTPLIGDFYGTNKIEKYRYYWGEGR